MYDQHKDNIELENIQPRSDNSVLTTDEYKSKTFEHKTVLRHNSSPNNIKLTGNLLKDIINLMSVKPEHYQISFTGLKRILGNVHQQQLVNTIDRLVDDSILLKAQDGYELASNMIKPVEFDDNWEESFTGKKLYLSPISVTKIYKDLYGKWFGKNRFLGGMIDIKNDEAFLEWINMTDRKSQTRLEVRSHELVAKFKNVGPFDRDKAINVFSETLNSYNNPVMFEKMGSTFINN